MKNMREISIIQLHESGTFINDFLPNIGKQLPPPEKRVPGLTLWDAGDKVLLRIESGGTVKEGFIPITNIKMALYKQSE